MRDDAKNATEVETVSREKVRTIPKVDVGTHLTEQEVITVAFSNNETNAQEIERVKIGSNKICIREDLAEAKMVSKKNSLPVVKMGNV